MQKKRLITAGGTLLCALGIGYFMQSATQSAPAPEPEQVAVAKSSDNDGQAVKETKPAALEKSVSLNEATLVSASPLSVDTAKLIELPAEPADPVVIQASLNIEPETMDKPAQSDGTPELKCEYALTAEPQAAAMVRLNLSAPCMPNDRFTVHHNGMMVNYSTDDTGEAEFEAPALSETAVFIVAFANGEGAVATVNMPSLQYYDRAVLQWRGASGMQLHALEFDADYGSEGHVWSGVARDLSAAASGQGGFITRHGSDELAEGLRAEVYTFPSGAMKRPGDVQLSIEAEVTQSNCGRDVEAQSIQKTDAGGLKTQTLSLSMPDCSAVGDFLVLKNMLNDLKIAAK